MKKISPVLVLLISFVILIISCSKINEATTLGGGLLPAVDNVKTFEVALPAATKNLLMNDSSRVLFSDQVALGDINDPEFGQVHANFSFNVDPASFGVYPFAKPKDSITAIDSVVLSLAYKGAYGDTMSNGIQTVSVQEIPYSGLGTGLRADSFYRYKDPNSDFTGAQLGSATYTIRRLGTDSITIKNPGDTVGFKAVNVVRIRLNNNLGTRLAQLDTSSASPNGGYASDSMFRTSFNGLSIKSAGGENALAYFSLTDTATKLIVYYRYKYNGKDTVGLVNFTHRVNGQSNYVNITPGGNWASALNNSSSDKIYIQSSPSGSYAGIKIPALDTFSNKVILRAEIIATPVSSGFPFSPPFRLMLDRIHHNVPDTAFLLQNDLVVGADGSINWSLFGGSILSTDGAYHLNITRYVQEVITRKEPNDSLRLYAPLRTSVYASNLGAIISLPVSNRIAGGRVVLAGGNYTANPAIRLRLRIVYSNL